MTTKEKTASPRKLAAVQRMVIAQNACDTAKRALRDVEAEFRFIDSDMVRAKTAYDLALSAHKVGLSKVNAAQRAVALAESEVKKLETVVAANRSKQSAA